MKRTIAAKTIVLLFLAAVLAGSMLPALAASVTTYRLDELELSVDIPSEYVVVTRDTDENDPNLAVYGMTRSELISAMTASNSYLDAWDRDLSFEITVTMTSIAIADFDTYSSTLLQSIASMLKSEYENAGIILSDYDVYLHPQTKFIKMHYQMDTMYGVQYFTVMHGKAVSIKLVASSGKVTAQQESIIEEIVGGVCFDEPADTEETAAPTGEKTDAFVYEDSETGLRFVVPENWVEKPLSKERRYLKAKFASEEDAAVLIMYMRHDIWEEMSALDKLGMSRKDCDNSVVSASDIAEMTGAPSGSVKTVRYGGKEYYAAETAQSASAYGIDMTVTMTVLVRLENGYLYMFEFSGDANHKLYGDFEALVSSAEYPAISGEPTSDDSSETTAGSAYSYSSEIRSTTLPDFGSGTGSSDTYGYGSKSDSSSGTKSSDIVGNLFLSLLLTIAVYSLPIVIYRYGIVKHAVEKKKAKRITIIYAIAAFIVMSVIVFAGTGRAASGGGIILWSWVNYKMLTGGAAAQESASEITCANCHRRYAGAGGVCPYCGTPAVPAQNAAYGDAENNEREHVAAAAETVPGNTEEAAGEGDALQERPAEAGEAPECTEAAAAADKRPEPDAKAAPVDEPTAEQTAEAETDI